MPHPVLRAGADLRLIRAAVFTAVCVLLSAGGHALASCAGVPPWTLGAGFLAVFAVVVPLAGRERSLPGIAAGLAFGQVALHALFSLGQHGMAGQAAGASGAMPQAGSPNGLADFAAQLVCDQRPMSGAEARRIIVDAGFDPAGHPPGMAMPAHGAGPASGVTDLLAHLFPTSLPMVLGHLLAALVLGWLLRRGEAAVWRAVELSAQSACQLAEAAFVRTLGAALALMCIPAPAQPLRLPRPRMRGRDERPAREPELQHFVIRRGPPRFDLAA